MDNQTSSSTSDFTSDDENSLGYHRSYERQNGLMNSMGNVLLKM